MSEKSNKLREKLSKKYEGLFVIDGEKNDRNCSFEAIPTGSLQIDLASGIGGLPRGRVVELIGPESGGKSTIALHIIREAQKKGLDCLYVDTEGSFDRDWAKKIGVNVEDIVFGDPETAEEGLDLMEDAVKEGIGVVVLDSVADLIPKKEMEGSAEDQHFSPLARVLTPAMRKIKYYAKPIRGNSLVICINQLRENINTFGFGDKYHSPGGKAIKHNATMRIEVLRRAWIYPPGEKENPIGAKTKVKFVKNKAASPFKVAECDIYFDRGIDDSGMYVDKAIELGVVKKAGTWFAFGNTKIQGRESFVDAMKEQKKIDEIIQYVNSGGIPEQEQETEENPFSG